MCWWTKAGRCLGRMPGVWAGLAVLFALSFVLLGPSPTPAVAQQAITIRGGDYWFCNASFTRGVVCTTEIDVGGTVVWDFTGALEPHTTTECGASCDSPTDTPVWDSGLVADGERPFAFTFEQPGRFLYYCQVHPADMRGEIVVRAPSAQPTATPVPGTETATVAGPRTPVPVPLRRPGDELPSAGQGPPQSNALGWWAVAALATTGTLAIVGGAWHARRRRLDVLAVKERGS